MTVRQDRMRMSVKLPFEAEEIGRAKAGADYLDFQRDTNWDMFGEKSVENYTKTKTPIPICASNNELLIIYWAANLGCGEVIFLSFITTCSPNNSYSFFLLNSSQQVYCFINDRYTDSRS